MICASNELKPLEGEKARGFQPCSQNPVHHPGTLVVALFPVMKML
jgi:hypothetical protein